MTFLPIVERELRVAARQPGTYWGRFAVAAIALGVAWLTYLPASMGGRGGRSQVGLEIFQILQWCAFPLVTLLGVLLTADALSKEMREGMLGLLFLTDLRGRDVVLGKLATHGTRILWGWLAVVPVIGLTLLLGGVTGSGLLRMMFVVGNSLFLSLAVGLLVSSLCRDGFKAVFASGLLIVLLHLGTLLADWCWAGRDTPTFVAWCSLASPSQLLFAAGGLRGGAFWGQWVGQHALAWGALAGAVFFVPRTWQERSSSGARMGGSGRRVALRRRWLDVNPITWLARQDRSVLRVSIWVGVAMVVGNLAFNLVPRAERMNFWWLGPRFLFGFLLPFWAAAQSITAFGEARRSGAWELLLVTPVTPVQILAGQQRAWWRIFGCLLVLSIGLHWLDAFGTDAGVGASKPIVPSVKILGSGPVGQPRRAPRARSQVVSVMFPGVRPGGLSIFWQRCLAGVTATLGLLAVSSLARWYGLMGRTPWVGALQVIALASWLPSFLLLLVFRVVRIALMGFSVDNSWVASLGRTGLLLAIDLWIIRWANARVRERLRMVVAEGGTGRPRPRVDQVVAEREEVVVGA